MHTVIETPAYLASAREVGLTEEERDEIVSYLARQPNSGDLMPGTGGARKLRFAGRSKGKSGGYRVITFFADEEIPVFLLDKLTVMLSLSMSAPQNPESRSDND